MHSSHGPRHHEVSPEARKAGHEVGDVPLGRFVRFGIGLAVLAVVSFFAAWVVFKKLGDYESRRSARPTPIQTANQGQLPRNPRLQVDPLKDWLVFAAEQDSIVSTYGWVDRAQGKVRLPVDVALEIMARRSWPHQPGDYRSTGISTSLPLGHGPLGHAPLGHGAASPGAVPHEVAPHGSAPHDSTSPGTPPAGVATPGAGEHH